MTRAMLSALPDGHRRTIELAYFGGLDQAEMGRALYLPLALTRSRLRTWFAFA
jgi:DNA-directed RNA polymerase specialized sigma24 family protein